jgi:predicted transcriptional regulator
MRISLTLPPAMVERLDAEAEQERRSRTQIVEFAIQDWFERRKAAG